MLRGWKRNEQLVDLNFIPANIKETVISSYNQQKDKGRAKLFNYFVVNRLKNLIDSINDF